MAKKTSKERKNETADHRERILLAAITVFSRTPFPYADLREITAESGLDKEEIKQYFSSMEDLYREVFDHVMTIHRKESLPTYLNWKASGKVSKKEATVALQRMLEMLIEATGKKSSENGAWAKIYLWEVLHPSPLYDEFYNKYFRENYTIITDVIMAATGSRNFEGAVCQSIVIFGMCLGFLVEREFLARYIGMKGSSKEDTRFVKSLVIRDAMAVLGLNVKESG